MPLKAKQPLFFNMHYINTTPQAKQVQVWLNMTYATGAFERAGAFVTFNTQISIPPMGKQTVKNKDGSTKDVGFDDPITFGCDVDPAPCREDCTLPVCGDEYLDPGEECDDGNQDDRDGCPNDCDA